MFDIRFGWMIDSCLINPGSQLYSPGYHNVEVKGNNMLVCVC